ncbi:helix-turn-helix transcriptional regulator [Persicimonas caeni]|uniref:Helix-turn-helix transcriptional regulator n=1 Tax=Persicimonas caeni TaxID=2292766 RepID=A0A4Y6PXS6_PERCE|nr:helix-turn-helix transcriptional regulator [Persicimonas caeni]QDG53132.1 helix-turn-helix transcriptional regulator [Persicimonas caeni]QED34354.1 helix-turn-helix transcriptional regulator [Persicimonas caeni]
MIGIQRELVGVVEAAYRLELERHSWLQGLADVLATMARQLPGLMVYVYDASTPEAGAIVEDYALHGLPESFGEATVELNINTAPHMVREVYHRGIICSTVSEILAPHGMSPEEHPLTGRLNRRIHIADCWGVSGSNPDGRGVGIAAPLLEVSALPEEVRELWGLVGVHLATAYRLRRGVEANRAEPEAAILDPGGKLVHAEGDAADGEAREALERATRRIDRARSGPLRHEPAEALPMWRGLVEGRWSLVDRWDSDGRRYVVAHPNDPHFDEPQKLTDRERQVVAYASQGDTNARISYSLGLDEPTVEALLHSALAKLGFDSRERLGELRRFFEDPS